ncbi:MAG TPA: bifunctional methylenetetrahydrofolate dehydrogenase/methenyltetrahydrofolate cyclohydrolase FolD [Bryobacteraceae bacterium]|nr:bifunctional methylenetetrahydrofolate dehydrogenase/methenyltetrahydrofolate cyclohydrolase FolD [Bryobacteraceae bacterium]
MHILDGTAVRARIFSGLKPRIQELKRPPGLAVVLVGHNPASEIYVRGKIKACGELGIFSEKLTPPETISTAELLAIIDELNHRSDIDAILVQMPLPKQVDSRRVLEAVAPEKDADGFHPINVGHLVAGRPAPRACTPAGVIEMLKHYGIPMDGRKAVVLGRSDIVGKPMALMLLHENATVTICHSRTTNLAEECRRADILVAAIGRPAMVTADYIAPGATVIDVGQNRIDDRIVAKRLGRAEEFDRKGYALVGDVHPIEVLHCAAAYTPVPGGVGPLTIAMLMANTVALAESHQSRLESNQAIAESH